MQSAREWWDKVKDCLNGMDSEGIAITAYNQGAATASINRTYVKPCSICGISCEDMVVVGTVYVCPSCYMSYNQGANIAPAQNTVGNSSSIVSLKDTPAGRALYQEGFLAGKAHMLREVDKTVQRLYSAAPIPAMVVPAGTDVI